MVHEKLVRNGLELQLLSAESAGALAAHLRKEQVDIPQEALAPLAPYTGPARSFVMVRIVDLPAYRAATSRSAHAPLGVKATFPSKEGYFPLVASSMLPGDHVDIVVTAPGSQRPSPPVPAGLATRHYLGYQTAAASPDRHAPSDDRLLYTRFTISGPPRALQYDLRFHPEAPPLTTRVAMAWMTSPQAEYAALLLGAVVFLALSVLASILARGAWPESCRPSHRRAAWIGLANVFTVVGVLVVAMKLARRNALSGRRAVRFVAAFSGIFCALLVGLAWLARLV